MVTEYGKGLMHLPQSLGELANYVYYFSMLENVTKSSIRVTDDKNNNKN